MNGASILNEKSLHEWIFKQQYVSRNVKIMEKVYLWLSILAMIVLFPIGMVFAFQVVKQFERAVVVRLGKLRKGPAKGPGLIFILPCTDDLLRVDLRTTVADIPSQEVLTRDSCTVVVDAVVYYSVIDPISAIMQVENFRVATSLLAATVLRNIVGYKNLSDLLCERSEIAAFIQELVDIATEPWGVSVERIEITDVRLPVQMQRAMAAEAEANREARAKVVAAEGELKAAKNLKAASDIIGANPTALQLRYLQTMNSISSEKNSTIIFPLPFDLLAVFNT